MTVFEPLFSESTYKTIIFISAPLVNNRSFTCNHATKMQPQAQDKCEVFYNYTRSHFKLSFHTNKRLQLTFCPQSSCKIQPWCQSSPQKQSFLSASFVQGPKVNLHIGFIKSPTSPCSYLHMGCF